VETSRSEVFRSFLSGNQYGIEWLIKMKIRKESPLKSIDPSILELKLKKLFKPIWNDEITNVPTATGSESDYPIHEQPLSHNASLMEQYECIISKLKFYSNVNNARKLNDSSIFGALRLVPSIDPSDALDSRQTLENTCPRLRFQNDQWEIRLGTVHTGLNLRPTMSTQLNLPSTQSLHASPNLINEFHSLTKQDFQIALTNLNQFNETVQFSTECQYEKFKKKHCCSMHLLKGEAGNRFEVHQNMHQSYESFAIVLFCTLICIVFYMYILLEC
jgi:hypothetical protein